MGGSHSRHDEYDWEAENRRRQEEEARQKEQAEAEEMANAARRAAEEARATQAELERQVAEAERTAAEEARRIREEIDRREREERDRRQREEEERRAREVEMARIAEETVRRLREMEDAANNARLAREQAERQAEAARMEVVAAEEAAKREEAAQAEAQRLADEVEKQIREEKAARKEAEKRLKEGRRPVELPTELDITKARRNYEYAERIFHIAIVGLSGTGKSSLINAFRGLSNKHPSAANTGVVETTTHVTRYPDPNPQNRFAWYDVPGAGTLDVPDWQYFNDQGLYVFNCIVVLFDTRFTASDVAVLRNCERFNIPSFIVRSKSDQHIQNLAYDMYQMSSDDDDNYDLTEEQLAKAREIFVNETRENVKANLERAGLSEQRVYIVSRDAMLGITAGRAQQGVIDERDLVRDILAVSNFNQIRSPPLPSPKSFSQPDHHLLCGKQNWYHDMI